MKQNKNKKMNIKLYILSIAVFMMFIAMSTFLVWFNMTNQADFFNNSYNSRQEIMAEQNIRGTIYSSDGVKLAYTETLADGTEKRVYPLNDLFCHVIGYDSYGKTGVESIANYELCHSSTSLNEKVNLNL